MCQGIDILIGYQVGPATSAEEKVFSLTRSKSFVSVMTWWKNCNRGMKKRNVRRLWGPIIGHKTDAWRDGLMNSVLANSE